MGVGGTRCGGGNTMWRGPSFILRVSQLVSQWCAIMVLHFINDLFVEHPNVQFRSEWQVGK